MKKSIFMIFSIMLIFFMFSIISNAATIEYDLYVERPASEAGNSYYSGVKYEPKTGAYLGMYAEGDSVLHDWNSTSDQWYFGQVPEVIGKDHAVYMVYVRYSSEDAIAHYASHYREAAKLGKAMQICLEPSNGLDEVQNNQHLIDLAIQAKDTGIPIFLRFANEFNTTGNNWAKDGPEKYKEKFKLVADTFHKYAPNVVMVWSPNDFPKENISQFYPGDSYVDWVGVSCYPLYTENGKCKLDNTWIDRFYQIYQEYSGRKPMMISEGAPSTTLEYKPNTNYSAQAAYEIKRFYASAARKCPRLKLIVYWSNDSKSGRQIHCRLTNNPITLAAYKSAVADDYYIGDFNTSSEVYYKKISETVLKCQSEVISSYVNNGKEHIKSAAYYIDGAYVGGGNFPDYSCNVNFAKYAGKTITLKADFYNESNKYVSTKTVKTKIAAQAPIKICVNGAYLKTDTDPVIINSRTLVPVRAISEALDSDVDWNSDTKTVTITKGHKTIKLKIGSTSTTVNNKNYTLDSPATIINNRTMVPVRFISEAFDAEVNWDGTNRMVTIEF